jgi:hypothetical protein
MLAKRATIWEAAVIARAAAWDLERVEWEPEWAEWAAVWVARAVVAAQAVARAVVADQAAAQEVARVVVVVVAAANALIGLFFWINWPSLRTRPFYIAAIKSHREKCVYHPFWSKF